VQRQGYESHSRKDRVTVGLELTPKLDWVTKHFQQDEGEVPSHGMTIIQSVSYRDRSLSRERAHLDLKPESRV